MVFKRQCESNQSQPIISINSDSVEWPKKWIWMLVWLARTVWAKTSSSHTIKSPNKLNPNTEKIELTTILIDVCGIVWHYCMHRYKPPLLPQRIKWEKKKKWQMFCTYCWSVSQSPRSTIWKSHQRWRWPSWAAVLTAVRGGVWSAGSPQSCCEGAPPWCSAGSCHSKHTQSNTWFYNQWAA